MGNDYRLPLVPIPSIAIAGMEAHRCKNLLLVRWLPLDVARIWGRTWLVHVLSPKSLLPIPKFPPSAHLSLPLAGLLAITRECGLMSSSLLELSPAVDEGDACAVCLERRCDVAAEVCGHELCVKCALDLSSVMKAYEVPGLAGCIPCPLCRSGIASFASKDVVGPDLGLCCSGSAAGDGDHEKSSSSCRPSNCQSYGGGGGVSPEAAALPLTTSAILS